MESVEEPNTGSEENVEPATSSKVARGQTLPGSKIKDLPGGLMGKILVYKSGKVKMKIGDALFDVSMKTVNCCILCLCICFPCNANNYKLPRYLPVQIACLSRRLWRLTPEKIIAAPWERSVSARLLPRMLAICWALLTRWKNKSMFAWNIVQENNL